MVKNLINEIEQAMLDVLNNEQLAQLRKVLDYTFRNIVVTEKDSLNTEFTIMTELEKCMAGEWYDCHSPEFIEAKARASEWCARYNATPYSQ